MFTGILLALFCTLFLLIDGGRIWKWLLRVVPSAHRGRVDAAAHSGWTTLSRFTQVQIFVAAVDAVGIGLGAWILGLFTGGFPIVLPVAVVVFLFSFVPLIGVLVAGAIAVLVALVALGPIPAVIMLAIVILVHESEVHVLQPLVMGSAVRIHPLAVVLAVAAGGYVAGVPGALFAVPLVAVASAFAKRLATPAPAAASAASSAPLLAVEDGTVEPKAAE